MKKKSFVTSIRLNQEEKRILDKTGLSAKQAIVKFLELDYGKIGIGVLDQEYKRISMEAQIIILARLRPNKKEEFNTMIQLLECLKPLPDSLSWWSSRTYWDLLNTMSQLLNVSMSELDKLAVEYEPTEEQQNKYFWPVRPKEWGKEYEESE